MSDIDKAPDGPSSDKSLASSGLLEVPTTIDETTPSSTAPAESDDASHFPLSIADLLDQHPSSNTSKDVEACLASCTPAEALRAAEAIMGMADEVDLGALERALNMALARSSQTGGGDDEGPSGVFERLRVAKERLGDWKAIYPGPTASPSAKVQAKGEVDEDMTDKVDLEDPWGQEEVEAGDVDLDDPWTDNVSDTSESPRTAAARPLPATSSVDLPTPSTSASPAVDLGTFLGCTTVEAAQELARCADMDATRILRKRRGGELFRSRLDLIAAFPPWVGPVELGQADLLPKCSAGRDEEMWVSEVSEGAPAVDQQNTGQVGPMKADEVREWYEAHIFALDELGTVDQQVLWVRQATTRGVTGLDAIGEDLSLLSRLVYDASLPLEEQITWTLSHWQDAESKAIVQAYLRGASSSDIVRRMQTMILPYLHVLVSRAERAGRPDTSIVERHLIDALLTLPLDLCLPVFEQSKATLPKAERIMQDDMAVARLALALLYGTDASAKSSTGDWATRSAIFECLPVWDISGRDPEDDAELTSTTLDSIAAFVRPSPAQPRPPKPTDLMMFFAPLPFASLSRALDILDVHLESGEILARWNTPVEMRFLLQSARDAAEQIELLKRMVKRASEQRYDVKRRREEEERWDRLWSDLLRLNGSGDQLLRGAFGMIDGADIMRVYLGGILRSGNFDTARKMISKLKINHDLTDETLGTIVLATSRELYDSASTGNLHTGDMKLAYDCLALAPQSAPIRREKDFIEATSRLATFTPSSASHSSKSALRAREIRNHPNKLDLFSDVLSTSPDVYKHEQMLIELAGKLGLSGDVAKGRMYAMLAEIAAGKRDWDLAVVYAEKGLEIVKGIDQRRSRQHQRDETVSKPGGESSEEAALRAAICTAAMRVGGSSADGWADVERKLALLGRTAEVCSFDLLLKVLDRWAEVEGGRIKLDEAAKRRRIEGVAPPVLKQVGRDVQTQPNASVNGILGSLRSAAQHAMHPDDQAGASAGTGEDRVLGSRRAARAARMAYGLGGMLGSQIPLPLARSASPASAVTAASNTVAGAAEMLGLRRGSGARGSSGSLRSLRDGHAAGDRPATPTSAARTSGEYVRALDGLAGRGGREEGLGLEDVERVRRGARRALVSGVGWLLGAEEGEI